MKKVILLTLLLTVTQLLAASYWEMKKEAYQLYKSGDKAKALELVERFIKLHPKEYRAQNLAAVFYYWQGKNVKAKALLEGVVAHTQLPEAQKLLKRLQKKVKRKSAKKDYQSLRVANAKKDGLDVTLLLSKIADNPQDIQTRVLLSKYYFKIGEYQKAYDMAYEVLEIDPHQKKMQKIASHLKNRYKLSYSHAMEDSIVDKQKAKVLLKELHQQKRYTALFNLYKALQNSHVSFNKEEYINILHAAIMIGEYKEAQKILSNGLVPVNKYTLKVQLLLSKKLASTVAKR